MEISLKGIGASPGIVIGKVLLLSKEEIIIPSNKITADGIDAELEKFEKALELSGNQIKAVRARAKESMGEDKAAIFDAQLDILKDPALIHAMNGKIKNELKNAALALNETTAEICAMFEGIEDEYLRERVSDIRDICGRIAQNLAGVKIVDLSSLDHEAVIIAKDLFASDTAAMDLDRVLAFATDAGGRTSHTSIMARSLEIPAVVGLGDATAKAADGDLVIVDGGNGLIYLNPDAETLSNYKAKQQALAEQKELLSRLKDLPAQTTDGKTVELCSNIGGIKDISSALKNGAQGVGLFRTEFLYMDSKHFPTEEEQFQVYKEAARLMEGNAVIIRTLDIGGDKELPYFRFEPELNPFLGWRAIRMCLDKVDIFKTQLRAILRASAFGELKIMFPMIISIEEFTKSKDILKECMDELEASGTAFDKNIQTGIMVETPAAVMLADYFAETVDFFSIGTNDLTQYTLAVDRGNERISNLYNPFHPAVIMSIKKIIDASHKTGKWTGMCGEFAGDEKAALLLLGLGLDEFSMSSSSIPAVKNLIRKVSFGDTKEMADKALAGKTTEDVMRTVNDFWNGLLL